MKPKNVANLLQNCLDNSIDREWFDDDIQPSMRKKYDVNSIVARIETLITILQDVDDE